MQSLGNVLGKVEAYVIDPIILVIFAAGFFLFVYGLVEFLWKLNQGADNKEGKQHMFWGVVGMLIMVSWLGIVGIISNTFHLGSAPNPSNFNVNISTNLFGS